MAEHERLIDALRARYGDILYTQNGQTYPVTLFPASADQTDVDDLLNGDFPREFEDVTSFPVRDDAHLADRKRTRTLTNGVTYVMHSLSTNPLRMTAKLGHYFDMMATCDALDHEMRDFARGDRSDTPLRDAFHAAVPPAVALHDGRGRSAVIGVATLLVFQREDGYQCILSQRSGKMATGAGLYHVMPAFVFQPSGPETFYAGEWSFKHHVLREFGEELFGMPEFTGWSAADAHDYFYSHPPVNDLRAMLADGRAELHLTGVALNLLSLRPEITAVLLIHDAQWHVRWQHALSDAQYTERQETRYIPLTTLDGLPDDRHQRMVPQGATAFWLGVERARGLIGTG